MTEQVGSISDEASRLFAAAEAWWRDAHTESPNDPPVEPLTGPECRICPLCQLLSLLRTTRPEVFEHLSSAAMSVLHAVRAAGAGHEHTGARPHGPAVERIAIR